jgi:hypothetical protein
MMKLQEVLTNAYKVLFAFGESLGVSTALAYKVSTGVPTMVHYAMCVDTAVNKLHDLFYPIYLLSCLEVSAVVHGELCDAFQCYPSEATTTLCSPPLLLLPIDEVAEEEEEELVRFGSVDVMD